MRIGGTHVARKLRENKKTNSNKKSEATTSDDNGKNNKFHRDENLLRKHFVYESSATLSVSETLSRYNFFNFRDITKIFFFFVNFGQREKKTRKKLVEATWKTLM